MRYAILQQGQSRSFPRGDPFLSGAVDPAAADVVLHLGTKLMPDPEKAAVLVELGMECLGVHTGEHSGEEGSNVLGFSRYRNGSDPPSPLIELVRQPRTQASAIDAAKTVFSAAGLTVVVCADSPGRIVDALVRPKYNAALRLLDEELATAADIDLTCRLGLGYPDGPIERVVRGGLAHHYEICRALFEIYGTPAYAPARRAAVAAARAAGSDADAAS
jgi:3-hydroxybutyryl-CoA dehydrogenase